MTLKGWRVVKPQHSLEVPQWGASNEYQQHMFSLRNKEYIKQFLTEKNSLSGAECFVLGELFMFGVWQEV